LALGLPAIEVQAPFSTPLPVNVDPRLHPHIGIFINPPPPKSFLFNCLRAFHSFFVSRDQKPCVEDFFFSRPPFSKQPSAVSSVIIGIDSIIQPLLGPLDSLLGSLFLFLVHFVRQDFFPPTLFPVQPHTARFTSIPLSPTFGSFSAFLCGSTHFQWFSPLVPLSIIQPRYVVRGVPTHY